MWRRRRSKARDRPAAGWAGCARYAGAGHTPEGLRCAGRCRRIRFESAPRHRCRFRRPMPGLCQRGAAYRPPRRLRTLRAVAFRWAGGVGGASPRPPRIARRNGRAAAGCAASPIRGSWCLAPKGRSSALARWASQGQSARAMRWFAPDGPVTEYPCRWRPWRRWGRMARRQCAIQAHQFAPQLVGRVGLGRQQHAVARWLVLGLAGAAALGVRVQRRVLGIGGRHLEAAPGVEFAALSMSVALSHSHTGATCRGVTNGGVLFAPQGGLHCSLPGHILCRRLCRAGR